MTDYSNILPSDPKEAQIMLSDTGSNLAPTPYNQVLLLIHESGDVSLESRTYYGGDGTPMSEWHRRRLTFSVASGADAEALSDELAEGGALARLIDRVIAGHSVEWDGSNFVGRLDEDAQDAEDDLQRALESLPYYDGQIASAYDWLTGGGHQSLSDAVKPGDTAEDMLAAAEGDNWIIIDGLAGFEEAVEEAARERAEKEEAE